MFVVKVGNYYVQSVDYVRKNYQSNEIYIGTIVLSKEIMRKFDKPTAEALAYETKGEVVEMSKEVTNEW